VILVYLLGPANGFLEHKNEFQGRVTVGRFEGAPSQLQPRKQLTSFEVVLN